MSQTNKNGFLITALGASAGGLGALENFFKHMPADAGIAFAVVQHLAPDHSSALPELLARHTRMTVAQARDNTTIVPNRVYIIPPNATLTIKDRTLRVVKPAEPRGHRTPIDSLFSSLAEDCGENAVCIMLSGTGTDGTLGLRAIKEHGGMAMAQTLESAQYDAILRSAIATGLVDHVLPVEEMPAKLLEYAAHLRSLNGKPNGLREQTDKYLGKIHSLLRQRAGHDFSQYKETTITRRLERRMKALQIGTVEQYIQVLEGQPEEADQLFKDLLIGVTQFFRDPEAFESLSGEVIPKLFESKGVNDQVRVCIVGCASGEEAYSIAMLLCEHAAVLDNAPKVQIFATDIDERGLAAARKGCYPESVAENVSAERLERFFIKQDGGYQVNRELRELCIFSSHSFIKDPPFSRLDLISCRNVMIYLGLDLQQKVLPLFHYALRSNGYLFLGPSESVTAHKELFRTIDKKHRIFQRKDIVNRPVVKFPLTAIGRPTQPGKQPETDERNLPKELERVIVQRYAPACAVVKENGEAVYFAGQISRYLQTPAGSPENNVINMAREGLRIPLRTSLHRAATSHQRAVQKKVSVQVNGGMGHVDLIVEPLPDFQATNLYMIVLDEVPPGPPHSEVPADAGSEEIIRSLESELRLAQEHAQAAYEELETSNEELQSANEEYQSTNEELETSKEELQSFNEELETVNSELNRKVAELEDAKIYAENIVDTVREPLLVLDASLRVKSANQSFYKTFGLAEHQTINHLLYDLGHREWDIPELRRLLSEMLPEKQRLEDFRVEHEFSKIGRTTMLLNARQFPQQNGDAPLILLAIEDITARSRAENSLREANQDLRHFAYAASHDLQEPLRMVTSYTQLLAKQYKGKLDPLADQSIAYAVEGAHQMEMLLKGLRDYWAVNEGKIEQNVVADCNHILDEALAYLQARIQESAARITHDPLPTVMAKDVSLVLLFKNLVGNALKYSRTGEPPRIHVAAQRLAKDWSFSVRDNGIGIEAAHLEKIFIPFKRLHAAEEYAGSGLGLAICQRIVERYNGRIWAESIFGEGSTFHFTIPLQGGG